MSLTADQHFELETLKEIAENLSGSKTVLEYIAGYQSVTNLSKTYIALMILDDTNKFVLLDKNDVVSVIWDRIIELRNKILTPIGMTPSSICIRIYSGYA